MALKTNYIFLVLLILFIFVGVLALEISSLIMSSNDELSTEQLEPLPFLNDPKSIQYVESSKLMVLVSGHKDVLNKISLIYGSNSSCILEGDESQRIAEAQDACAADRHVVAIDVKSNDENTDLKPYAQIAWDNNYVLTLVNASQGVLPQYVGWHLNEADSCMLGLCAHALLEDLLRHVSEFCSDFRNFTQSETISEMLKYYELASSNHNGMLHCTAFYLGNEPSSSSKEYFERVEKNVSMNFETTVIGLVFTPRTFGARLKLSPEQLKLWGGDDTDSVSKESMPTEDCTEMTSLCSSLKSQSINKASQGPKKDIIANKENSNPLLLKKKSPRYFPNCQASLVCSSPQQSLDDPDDPDFHPVTGAGRKAHMTIGVAPDVSAVTTGYDLLEIVALESQGGEWPTYNCSRGWLRDYGEGRWVLYMNSKITVDSLFAGVYNFP